jgi:hypothetical protein
MTGTTTTRTTMRRRTERDATGFERADQFDAHPTFGSDRDRCVPRLRLRAVD